MTLRELLLLEEDNDVYNTLTTDVFACICGPLHLTEEGMNRYKLVLDKQVDRDMQYGVTVHIDHLNELSVLHELCVYQAGYCTVETYNKYFKEDI